MPPAVARDPSVVQVQLHAPGIEIGDAAVSDRRKNATEFGSDAKNAVFTSGECAIA